MDSSNTTVWEGILNLECTLMIIYSYSIYTDFLCLYAKFVTVGDIFEIEH